MFKRDQSSSLWLVTCVFILLISRDVAAAREQHRYDHNGSIVLFEEDDHLASITYEKPSRNMAGQGVKPGTVLFIGRRQGERLVGKASLFSARCGALHYSVTGEWLPKSIRQGFVLSGASTPRDASCKVGPKRESNLGFLYIPKKTVSYNTNYSKMQSLMLKDYKSALQMLRHSYVPTKEEVDERVRVSKDLGRGVDASFCMDTLTIYDYSPQDRFIEYFEYMIAYQSELGKVLEATGYPRNIWSFYLDSVVDKYVERLSELFENGAIYDYGAPRPWAELEVLSNKLAQYRAQSKKRLLKVTVEGCGGDWYGDFTVKVVGSGTAALRSKIDESFCAHLPRGKESSECGAWISVLPGVSFPFGRYRYKASWPDGTERTGEIEGTDSPIVIEKPGG